MVAKEYVPKRLQVSEDLAKIIETKKGQKVTRAQAMKKLWAYIKEKGLKDPEDRSQFTPDKNMQPIFGSSKQLCFGMSKQIKNHLTKN